MAFRLVGTASISASDWTVPVGAVSLPSTGGLAVRIRQTSPAETSVFWAGLIYVDTAVGRILGSRRFWGHLEGEDHVLGGPGYRAELPTGVLKIEPRTWNRRALRYSSLSPWVLEVWADDAPDADTPTYQAPGFVDRLNRLLRLTPIGGLGRITF